MTWAQRLNIDIEICRECGGAVKVIACIEDPVVIQRSLNHLKEKSECQDAFRLRQAGQSQFCGSRAPEAVVQKERDRVAEMNSALANLES